jgi:two-component system, cell cycle response regulator DivK
MSNNSILVVDDAAVNLKLARVLLSRQGFDVRTADNAEEALETIRDFRPRLVLADIQLPGMNGLELTRRVKSDPANRDIIVVALTAFAMQGDEQRAMDAGCDGYITKPIDTRTFPALIRGFLHSSGDTAGARGPASNPEVTGEESPFRELQHGFLAEAIEQNARLISTLGGDFDVAEALIAAHRWVGAGGSVGFPEISQNARELESALQRNGPASLARTRELLTRQAELLADAMQRQTNEKGSPEPASQPVSGDVTSPVMLSALAGKRFALAGFPAPEAARLAGALDRYESFSRDLGAATLPGLETVRPFDMIILNVTAVVKTVPQWNKPVLLIGARELLLRMPPHNSAEDFLFSPWTGEEVVLRCYFAISRGAQAPVQVVRKAAEKGRVLVADDDSTIRALVEATVQNSGLECRVATNGGEALELVRSWQPDLAVLDVNMPDRNGFEVLSELRNDPRTRDTRVILLTARQQETDVIRGFGLGADDYVIKPFSPMELIARLKRLLGKPV